MIIRPRILPSGRKTFQLDLGLVNGKRKQLNFQTRSAADDELALRKAAAARHGSLGAEITGMEMAEIVTARKRLQEAGATISEATDFFLKHATRLREELTVPELVERFRESREVKHKQRRGENAEPSRYVKQLKVSLASLVRLYPQRKAHDMTQDDIENWLEACDEGWSPKTRDNYLGDVSTMYNWAIGKTRGYARINPTLEVERINAKGGKIVALPLERACELLQAAAEQRAWRVLGYLVLGMLGGIRPAEIQRLDWSAVDLQGRTVIVLATDAKTAARRVVDLTKEAVAWLKLIPEAQREGPVIDPAGWVDEWTVFRRELGWDVGRKSKHLPPPVAAMVHGRWPHNAMRHTFASMHYAEHQNEALLQVQMGHRSAKMIHQHYRAVKTRAEAKVFWRFGPSKELVVVSG